MVIAGVAGTGKTSVGLLVASELGWPFADGDSFHTTASVAKMRSGAPLTDADRRPWLQAIAAWIGSREAAGGGGVVACSALKRSYRDLLRDGHPAVRFAFLTAPMTVLDGRLRERQQNVVPAALLAGQLADLERLGADEPGANVDASGPTEHTAAAIRSALTL